MNEYVECGSRRRPLTIEQATANKDYIDWVERMALENLRCHIQSADALTKEGNSTLTILLGGAGASITGVLSPTWAQLHWITKPLLAILAVALFACAAYIVRKVLWARDIEVPTGTPNNLMEGWAYGLDDARRGELENIEEKVRKTIVRNAESGDALNGARLIAIASVVVAIVVNLCAAAASAFYG